MIKSTVMSRSSGDVYYVNDSTGESTFDRPTEAEVAVPDLPSIPTVQNLPPLPSIPKIDKTGEIKKYFDGRMPN